MKWLAVLLLALTMPAVANDTLPPAPYPAEIVTPGMKNSSVVRRISRFRKRTALRSRQCPSFPAAWFAG